ncbi:MAG TPA: hypothetical protein VIV60_17860, partial [Polyangiaceae bacterium]
MQSANSASKAFRPVRAALRIVDLQVSKPWHFLFLAIVLTLPAFYFARQLELRTGFDSLLPENKPSVIELKRVAKRTAGVSTLAIVIDGAEPTAMERFADALVPKLRALGPDWVGTAESGVHAEREFIKERQALFLPLAKVQEIHTKIEERYQREIFGSIDDEPLEP